MPFEVKFAHLPGISVEAAPRGATSVKVQAIGFASAEDGDVLIRHLEGFGSDLLAMLPEHATPGQVNHLLAIIRRDRSATVYLNEVSPIGEIQPKRGIAKGDPVFSDDVADIRRLTFEGVEVPKDAGVVYIFCVGWRRAMFFDLLPLNPLVPTDRDYDLGVQLARHYAYLLFQERFKITPAEWDALLAAQWFPFVTLRAATIRSMLGQASNGWPLDDLVEPVASEVRAQVPALLERWRRVAPFQSHLPFLEQAAERYLANDYISTTAILFPRIEGVMRSHQRHADPAAPASQTGLAGSAVRGVEAERHEASLLLPRKFRRYIEDVYFAGFDPGDPKIKVSRNSVGHGVAAAEECSVKSAAISILLTDQLAYCFAALQTGKAAE